jgi:hypothetical protein
MLVHQILTAYFRYTLFSVLMAALCSCQEGDGKAGTTYTTEKGVLTSGYPLPSNSISPPKVTPAGSPEIVQDIKMTTLTVSTNTRKAGRPKVVIAGTPVKRSLVLGCIYAVYRFQRQRLIQKERERARIKELAQANEIEKAYSELTSTQAQLIQREKMASCGTGMPQQIAAKVFQPFFTTKPTGQGKGSGLSLSHDIIKAHGGELRVAIPPAGRAGKKCEGAEFIIELPIIES